MLFLCNDIICFSATHNYFVQTIFVRIPYFIDVGIISVVGGTISVIANNVECISPISFNFHVTSQTLVAACQGANDDYGSIISINNNMINTIMSGSICNRPQSITTNYDNNELIIFAACQSNVYTRHITS